MKILMSLAKNIMSGKYNFWSYYDLLNTTGVTSSRNTEGTDMWVNNT